MSLESVLQNIPHDASEAIVENLFSRPLLKELGFGDSEIIPGYPVGSGFVDQAARKNLISTEENDSSDIFLHTKTDPFLFLEAKARTVNFLDGHKDYLKALAQLKKYLLHPRSDSVKWGILTNSAHLQLFRKHGKVIHPITPCVELESDVKKVVKNFKTLIENPRKALVITVYNNKGGVGKTTTTLNLAATLTVLKKRVLVIDFDPNQSDLTDALNLPLLKGEVMEVLKSKQADIHDVINPYRFIHPKIKNPIGFDVVCADEHLVTEIDEQEFKKFIKLHALRRLLESVRDEYDYILIDAPPNWRIFAQKALYASDVVLIPARHDNLHSLQNAGTAIARFIPEIQKLREGIGEAGPIALPIFMNSAFKVPDPQKRLMEQAVIKIIKETKVKEGVDLTPYFFPHYKGGQKDLKMINIPYMAYISKSDFLHVPAAFAFQTAREQYMQLVREYFL